MLYKIDFLDNDDTPLYGYIEAVSPHWARMLFENDYDFEITDISEFKGQVEDAELML